MKRKKICVLGGSGFIGQEICRLIVAMGHHPVSVSRSGRPALDEPWVEGVEWVRADILDTHETTAPWLNALAGCDALIYAVGCNHEDAANVQNFERLHRDSVELSARAAADLGVAKFVLISASDAPPGTAAAYLQSKRAGECALDAVAIPAAILRPNFIHTNTTHLHGALARATPEPIDMIEDSGNLSALQQWVLETPGLRLEKVAMAALRAALQPQTVGVLEPEAIDYLGDAMFIQ